MWGHVRGHDDRWEPATVDLTRQRKFNPHGRFVATILALGVSLLALSLLSAPAIARFSEVYSGQSFGPDGTGPGKFKGPQGIAVDHSSGDVYVYEAGFGSKGAIYKFDEKGEPEDFSGLGASGHPNEITEIGGFYEAGAEQVAVDNSTGPDQGDIYVANNETVKIYSPAGIELGQLNGGGEPCGVAVDASGNVYVGEYPETVKKYVPTANPVTGGDYAASLSGLPSICTIAVDASGDLYAATYEGGVHRYEPSQFNKVGTPASGELVDSSGNTLAVAPGAGGHLYIDEWTDIAEYDVEGAPKRMEVFGGSGQGALLNSYGVAAQGGASGDVYASGGEGEEAGRVEIFGPGPTLPDVTVEPVSDQRPTSVTLNGTVNPAGGGEVTCQFEYGTSEAYENTVPCSPEMIPSGTSTVSVTAGISGLQPGGTTYYVRLSAANSAGTSRTTGQFVTTGPAIGEPSASEVEAGGAELRVAVNPRGAATFVYFRYGTAGGTEASVPAPPGEEIGEGEELRSVAARLEGLTPDTTYSYQVVVVQNGEEIPTAKHTFTTTAGESIFALPDGRQWELVSPVQKRDAHIIPPPEEGGLIQAAGDGHAITYLANGPMGVNQPASNPTQSQILAERTSHGWISRDISPPGETEIRVGTGLADRAFSSDLATAIVEPLHDPIPLASNVPAQLETETYSYALQSGLNTPLVTSVPPLAHPESGYAREYDEIKFAGASSNAQHVVITSYLALTSDAVDAEDELTGKNLYEWSDGALRLVNILPDGSATKGDAALGGYYTTTRNAISADGSRVVWSKAYFDDQLYTRDLATGKTLEVDESQGGPGSSGEGQYQDASADGVHVFFLDEHALTSEADSEGEDLYAFDGETDALTDITADKAESEGARVRIVIGVSADGSYVYFVANGALAQGATPGAENLYVAHREGSSWTTSFIAKLSKADRIPRNSSEMTKLSARVSPSGRFLTFMSSEPLTGYDNVDVSSGERDEEVYLYDAAAAHTICASCDPTGERPAGEILPPGASIDPLFTWLGAPIAALVPSYVPFHLQDGTYQPRYLSDSGRLFFDSIAPLVPHDSNGQVDVYEFEPEGVGGCTSATSSASRVYVKSVAGAPVDGCVGLISSGTSPGESAFLDASESGGDVFFMTQGQLAREDVDGSTDIYDARECTSAEPCRPQPAAEPEPCATAEACRAAPGRQPDVFGTPSSGTFLGEGNVGTPARCASQTKKRAASHKHKRSKRAARKRKGNSRGRAAGRRTKQLASALKRCKRRSKPKPARCRRRARRGHRSKPASGRKHKHAQVKRCSSGLAQSARRSPGPGKANSKAGVRG